jgi:hypothetical protein
MDHDMHDDGLVHGHGWATEPPPSVGMLLRPANDRATQPQEGTSVAAQPGDAVGDDLIPPQPARPAGTRD